MKIAILGWGSLIWNPQNLQFNVESSWILGGPVLPIEYSRISDNGRLTLVITKEGTPNKTFFALSTNEDLKSAIENLRNREGTITKNIGYFIKKNRIFFPENFDFKENILNWIEDKDIDAVIWTNIPERWKEICEDRINYLKSLDTEKKELAMDYIIKTPIEIKTKLRVEIETQLNW